MGCLAAPDSIAWLSFPRACDHKRLPASSHFCWEGPKMKGGMLLHVLPHSCPTSRSGL